jgi:hypothetical protein
VRRADAPYGIKLTPMMRHQSGDQIGRIIQHGFNGQWSAASGQWPVVNVGQQVSN